MKRFTKEEEEFLRDNYPHKGQKWCADKLGVTVKQIESKVQRMGLKVTKARRSEANRLSAPERIKKIHGLYKSKCYPTWNAMMQRCYNSKRNNSKYYSEKGIGVCDEWHDVRSFKKFYDKHKKPGLTLERIDSNKDYSPENCKFATPAEQSRNRPGFNVINQKIADEIRELYKKGIAPKSIREKFNLTKSIIDDVLYKGTWS